MCKYALSRTIEAMSEAVADGVLEELRGLGPALDVRDLDLPGARAVGPWRVKQPKRRIRGRNRRYL